MKKNKYHILSKTIRRYAKKDPWLFPIAIGYNMTCAVMSFIYILLTSLLLDGLSAGWSADRLLQVVLSVVILILIVDLLKFYLMKKRSEKWLQSWSIQDSVVMGKSLRMDYEYLENNEAQFLMRKQNEYAQMHGALYFRVLDFVESLSYHLTTVIISVVLIIPFLVENPLSILVIVVLVGGMIWLQHKEGVRKAEKMKLHTDKWLLSNRLSSYYCHTLLHNYESGKDIRIFGQQEVIKKELKENIKRMEQMTKTKFDIQFHEAVVVDGSFTIISSLLYLGAGFLVFGGKVSIGNAVKYINSILSFADSFNGLIAVIEEIRDILPYAEDFEAFQNLEKKKAEGTIPVEKRSDNKFLLEFRNVSFQYPNMEEFALKNINLKMEIGERMAVVGRNGSGKTTFIKLLCRLYDCTEGEIRLNGVDIRKYDEQEYLAILAVVFQDYHIFDLKIGENIAASQNVEEERAVDAMKRAGLEELLIKLPEGIHTYIGKNFSSTGFMTSGGENQKLAIARAIYHQAPFVIMDEPTAALDPVAEYEVYAGFDRLVGSRTAIYISHRLSSCRFCNDILVFDEGKVVQRGSHEELLAQEGLYAQMWNAQAQYYK